MMEPETEMHFRASLAVHQRAVEDIHDWQQRQWHVVYYALLLMGGIAGLFINIDKFPIRELPEDSVAHALRWLAWIVVLISAVMLGKLQNALCSSRQIILNIQNRWTEVFPKELEVNEEYAHWRRDADVLWLFTFVLVVAAGLVDSFMIGKLEWTTCYAVRTLALLGAAVIVLKLTDWWKKRTGITRVKGVKTHD